MHVTFYSECAPKDRTSRERQIRLTLVKNGRIPNLVIAFVYNKNEVAETIKKKRSVILLVDEGCKTDNVVNLRKLVIGRCNGSSPKMLTLGTAIEGMIRIKSKEEVFQYA